MHKSKPRISNDNFCDLPKSFRTVKIYVLPVTKDKFIGDLDIPFISQQDVEADLPPNYRQYAV